VPYQLHTDAAVCSWPGCAAACTAATSRWYEVGTTRFAPSSLLGDASAGPHMHERPFDHRGQFNLASARLAMAPM